MRIVRGGLIAATGLCGLAAAARALFGPFTFLLAVRTPINAESFCGLCLTLFAVLRFDRQRVKLAMPPRNRVLCIAAVCGLVAFGFWRAIHIYFLADDFVLVKFANAFRLHDLPVLLTTPEGNAFFRPVIRISMALTALWAGFDPRMWHFTSLVLHAANSVLVFALAWRLGLSRNMALFAGSLFAIHGSLPESAVWIAGWYGLLSTFFVLCGLLAFLAQLQNKSRVGLFYGAASLTFMTLGFLCKETAYAFPFLALLLAISQGDFAERAEVRRATTMMSLFLGVALAIFVYRWHLLGGIGGYTDLKSGTPLFFQIGGIHVLQSLLLRLWAILYFPINWSTQPGLVLGALCVAYVGALLWMMARTGKRLPLLFPLGFVLFAALPPIQELLIGPDLQKSRELYLPLAGFCLLLATAAESLEKSGRWIVPVAILLFQFGALQHNLTVWERAGDAAKRACLAATRCEKETPSGATLSVWNLPGSLDGVYFLGVGFPECTQLQNHVENQLKNQGTEPRIEFHSGKFPAGYAGLLWDPITEELRCDANAGRGRP